MLRDDGGRAMRGHPTIDARLARHALADPHADVVIQGDRRITRLALERRADGIAHRLSQYGIGPGQVVGLCLARGIDQIAASLAVLKVGAACLPLSPNDPAEMLRFRLADCDVALILAEERDLPIATASRAWVMVLQQDDGREALGAPPRAAPADGSGVAWIAPTSGAIGSTCGAEITHDNLIFLSEWLQSECGIARGERVGHMADPGTAAALLEVWPPLMAGATVIVMDDRTAASAALTRKWIEEERVTALVAGEEVLDALAECPLGDHAALRLVVADIEHTRRYPAHPSFRLVATYGHEECSMISSAHYVARNERPGGPHIGNPIKGATIHILDPDGTHVPDGEEGEMWIGGPGVARGYRNRPDLTSDRFVPDPFGADPAGMIFRTGRRGRAFIGGEIGRTDHTAGAR